MLLVLCRTATSPSHVPFAQGLVLPCIHPTTYLPHPRRHESLYELIEDKLIRSDEFPATTRELKMMMGDACVILSTVSMLSNPKLHQLRMFTDVMPVERLVIDEASQINVFEFMVRISRFVMTVHGRVVYVL